MHNGDESCPLRFPTRLRCIIKQLYFRMHALLVLCVIFPRVQVDPESRLLKISADMEQVRDEDSAKGGVNYHITERTSGSAYRNLRLPPNVDVNQIGNAAIQNGVLTLTLPKSQQGQQQGSRSINIQ